ncbi:MAG: DJ-1/PfpI family protein [Lachnospiraceae bacterium]|nr:DJ-1/PfpI family protein [Lachnospiraceae bacterium]
MDSKTNFVFLAEGFEEIEALTVVDILRRAGLPCLTVDIANSPSRVVNGSHQIPVIADVTLDKITDEQISSLILPGGMPGTKNLLSCEALRDLILKNNSKGTRLAAICAAPTILAELGILKGVNAACYPTSEDKLAEAGAIVSGAEVITDGHITTSRGMGTAISFAVELVRLNLGEETAREIESKIVYRQ